MKPQFRSFIMFLLIGLLGINGCLARSRVIKGTVYTPEGKPAAGVLVTADRSKDRFYTSFDGAYVLVIDFKSSCLKFKFSDREEKLDITGIKDDVINFGRKAEATNTSPIKNGSDKHRLGSSQLKAIKEEDVNQTFQFRANTLGNNHSIRV